MTDGSFVFVRDEALVWTPARQLSKSNEEIEVQLLSVDGRLRSNGESFRLTSDAEVLLQNLGSDGQPDQGLIPDLTILGHLHEASILYSIRRRHEQLIPYT